MADVIPFKEPVKRKRKRASKKPDVMEDLIMECLMTGQPDAPLMLQVLRDMPIKTSSLMDVLAVYLYRKKANG